MKKNQYTCLVVCFIVIMLLITPMVNSLPYAKGEPNDNNVKYTIFENLFKFFNQKKISADHYNTIDSNDDYDLLIITPTVFLDAVEPLKNHKNAHGIKTVIVTTEEIYLTHDKEDKAEEIKYCIKDFYDTSNISYVLLVGGLKTGLKGFFGDSSIEDKWHVPGRYSYLDLDGFPEYRYLCDLYFADLYDDETHKVFQTWNTDQTYGRDDWFGEWRWENGQEIIDARDLIPDVAVGRLPCRDVEEVEIIVNKIINYEDNTRNSEWLNQMILVGGDSLDDNIYDGDSIIEKGNKEGKYASQHAFEWVKNRHPLMNNISFFPHERSVESDLDDSIFPGNFFDAFNDGSCFTYLVGHGDKGWWFNHPVHGDHQNFSYIRYDPHIKKDDGLLNGDRLPVLVLDGCHMCDFSTNFQDLFISKTIRCFGYVFLKWKGGGSIASIGNTAVCYGSEGERYLYEYDGCLYARFFEEYGNGSSEDLLGDYLCRAIARYVDGEYLNDEGDVVGNILHTKCIESTVLLGDPSLMVGGF